MRLDADLLPYRILERVATVTAVVAAPLAAVVGIAWAATQPGTYESETTLVVAPSPELDADPRASLDATNLLRDEIAVATLSELAENQTILAAAASDLGLGEPPEVDVATATPPTSAIVSVTISGEDAEQVHNMAVAVAARAVATFEETYPVLSVRTVGEARLDDEASGTSPLLGAVVGLVLGGVLAWLAASVRAHFKLRSRPSIEALEHSRRHPGQAS